MAKPMQDIPDTGNGGSSMKVGIIVVIVLVIICCLMVVCGTGSWWLWTYGDSLLDEMGVWTNLFSLV